MMKFSRWVGVCHGCGETKEISSKSKFCTICESDPRKRPLLMNSKCKNGHVLKDVGILVQRDGHVIRWRCKGCQKQKRERMQENKTSHDLARVSTRKSRIFNTYGITIEDWMMLYQHQNGICPICGKELRAKLDLDGHVGKVAAVDHDHKTRKIRGLVCRYPCNYVLGYLHDNATMFLSCSNYLNSPPAYSVLDATVPIKKKKGKKKSK